MTPHDVLEKYFGFREFLDAQEEVINAITGGADALVVMPTGGGKSLCYQLPALLLEGTTVVVSPLIALMKDQVDALQRRGISATVINSSITLEEQRERIRALARGEFKLVYIAPERFRSRSFLEALGQSTIALFAVDEAHCLSMWGHDFRPDYFRLDQVLETLGRPQVAAFTATATPEVRRDILTHLRLREPREFVAGFARPNLKLLITHVANEPQKYERLNALIRENKTGIVYCSTRKRVEAVAETLKLAKISSILYHGGMNDEEREKAQNEFMQGHRDIVVATNAFGMGIDRADIRFVVHFDVPGRRVRGTRLLQPEVRGTQLKLDAAKLREKERRDRAKLKLMVDFAYARTCRQQAILRYFGEEDPTRCGNCDICLETAGPARAPGADEALIVRKALSGVARMSGRGNEGWEPRFGRGRIVQTLVGSRSREIIQARLDQLSTYGLLQSEGVAYLNQLLRELQDAGMLVSSG